MPKYETHTSQFSLVGGIRQDTSSLVALAEPRNPLSAEARKGRLYMLVESEQPRARSQEACHLVISTMRKAFYTNDSFSVTSSLRAALLETNQTLYQQNVKYAPQERVCVGITCAVVKEYDLFVAQVAPAQAFVLSGSRLRAMPTHPSWDAAHLSATPFLQNSPLGQSLYVDPELYRCSLTIGDMLLLCSSNLAPLLTREQTLGMLAQDTATQTIDALHTLTQQQQADEAHAIAVKLATVGIRSATVPPATQRPRPGLPSLGSVGTWIRQQVRLPRQAHTPTSATTSTTIRLAPERDEDFTTTADHVTPPPPAPDWNPNPAPIVLPIDVGETLEEQHARQTREREASLPPSALLGEGDYRGLSALSAPPIDLSDPELKAPPPPYGLRHQRRPVVDMTLLERLLLPFQRVATSLRHAATRPRVKPPRPHSRRNGRGMRSISSAYPKEQPARSPVQTVLMFLFLSGLVVMLILYGTTVSQRQADERTLSYLALGEERMDAVEAAPDAATAAERLERARQALQELRNSSAITDTNAAFWLRYQELKDRYEQAESSVHLITYLDNLTVVAEHPTPGRNFSRLAVPPPTSEFTATEALQAVQYIYALDGSRENARLYRIPRNGGPPEPYLSPNQAVQSTIVGPLQAVAWRLDNVVAIDQASNSFGYFFHTSSGWNHIRLGGSEIWTPGSPIDLETYEGNLYIWGAEPNEILKFSSGRYGDIPELWLDPTGLQGHDIGTSIDMAIDGLIYLLQSDGRILALSQGRVEREIIPAPLTPPISVVTRFFTIGPSDSGFFFLLDTPHERIIQIDKQTGAIIQQMRVREDSPIRLNQLIDIYVDTGSTRPVIYLTNGDQIVRTPLPIPPTPFEPGSSAQAEAG